MRKGICLMESRDAPLTETTLVQTAPIRLNAHMAVIDGIMSLFIKEVLIPEKIVDVVKKFSSVNVNSEMPSNSEEAAVLWINKCCRALEQEIKSESGTEEKKVPKIPVVQEISDISDGCSLAAVICYYCPSYFRWQDVHWNDSTGIYNLQLVKKFCSECLPREINFLTLEDLLYLHPSIKENVLAFVADLLYMFVIWRASCVTRRREKVHSESSLVPLESSKSLSNFPSHKSQTPCSPIPNLRSDSYGGSTSSLPDIRTGNRYRNYGSKEKLSEKVLTKKSNFSNEDLGPNLLQRTNSVGMVNGWKGGSLPYVEQADSAASSPRHTNLEISRPIVEGESSSSNISQPSAENAEDSSLARRLIRASRDDIGVQKSPPKESTGFGLRKSSESGLLALRPGGEGNMLNGYQEQRRGRRSLEEYYSHLASGDGPLRSVSASNITENKSWKSNNEKSSPKSFGGESVPGSSSSQSSGICLSDVDTKHNFSTTSFAQLSKLRDPNSNSISIVYMPHERDVLEKEKFSAKSPNARRTDGEGKKTTFAALPNTTTWQQQRAANINFPQTDSGHETPTESSGDNLLNVQLCDIRMKLEEKKRKIELKKKRMELLWKKQRQKLGKAAFLQAVSKNAGIDAGTPDSGTGKEVCGAEYPQLQETAVTASPTLVKRMSMQEIAEDLDNVQKKWLNQNDTVEQLALQDTTVEPSLDFISDVDTENLNIDLQTSIEHLNTSLTDLQADISRISLQQEQVENLMKDSIDDSSHFFLHSQLESPISKGHAQWDFNDSSFLTKRGICFTTPSFVASPQIPGQNFINNQTLDSTAASLPPFPSLTRSPAKEDLYSKIIKPENRQKQNVSKPQALASVSNKIHSENIPVISSHDPSKSKSSTEQLIKSKPTTEIHVVLPQVPDNKLEEPDFHKKSKDDKQGFYIPIEKDTKKTKSKTLRSMKPALEIDVPKQVSDQMVPTDVPEDTSSFGFVIGADLVHPDPEAETEMARKKEMIMNMSIQRKAEYERKRAQKEQEYARIKEEERRKQEYLERKKEEEKRRREAILEQYRQRKLQEEFEKEGSIPHKEVTVKPSSKLRTRKESRPRPKSAYVPMNSELSSLISMANSAANKRNSHIYSGREMQEFDLDSLNSASTSTSSHDRPKSPSNCFSSQRNANLQVPEGSGPSSDGASDTASNGSSVAAADYTGPKLFVKPTAKSNRGIIINAINTVLAGAVNADTKKKVLEEINRSESKHFLILFRDAGCQFRALYTYNPEREEVCKLYGIGPKHVIDKMMDRFYKYNSGGKCFSEIQTKHLTVTIDAFTIPNSLWAGKKVIPPRKEFF
ncbi:Short spindle protein 4, partial [Stegodyphus mimosarum]